MRRHGRLYQGADGIDTVYLIPVKTNLRKINSEILFQEHDDFNCVY